MSLKSKIQSLITASNLVTSETDINLTSAVQHLVDGYIGSTVQATSGSFVGYDNVNCGFAPDVVIIHPTSALLQSYTEDNVQYSVSWSCDFRNSAVDYLPTAYVGNYDNDIYGIVSLYVSADANGFSVYDSYSSYEPVPRSSLSTETYIYTAIKLGEQLNELESALDAINDRLEATL